MDRTPREVIVFIGRRLSQRWTSNAAGGNMSLRVEDRIYISPRYADYQWGWELRPDDIVCGPIESNELLDNPSFSREGRAHLGIYRAFPEAGAIIHAHPFYVMPFCAANKAIEPILDATRMLGRIEPVPYAAPNSQELADNIVEGLRGKQDQIADFAAAVLMPKHGITLAGKDLYATYDALVKIDMTAWSILAQSML